LYCKNIGGFEEVYQIPMTMSGPGIAAGVTSKARVGLHDVAPTLLELCGEQTIGDPDARSFASALKDDTGAQGDFARGFAEYHGGRYRLTQRIIWDGPWKLVWNGFDFDELYHLDDDPQEMRNLIDEPANEETVQSLMHYAWQRIKETNDQALLDSHYPVLRLAPYGPNIIGAG
jgi:arylsulfatase A-like enzyme